MRLPRPFDKLRVLPPSLKLPPSLFELWWTRWQDRRNGANLRLEFQVSGFKFWIVIASRTLSEAIPVLRLLHMEMVPTFANASRPASAFAKGYGGQVGGQAQ